MNDRAADGTGASQPSRAAEQPGTVRPATAELSIGVGIGLLSARRTAGPARDRDHVQLVGATTTAPASTPGRAPGRNSAPPGWVTNVSAPTVWVTAVFALLGLAVGAVVALATGLGDVARHAHAHTTHVVLTAGFVAVLAGVAGGLARFVGAVLVPNRPFPQLLGVLPRCWQQSLPSWFSRSNQSSDQTHMALAGRAEATPEDKMALIKREQEGGASAPLVAIS